MRKTLEQPPLLPLEPREPIPGQLRLDGGAEDAEEGAALPPPADEAPEGSEQTEEPEDTEITPEQ